MAKTTGPLLSLDASGSVAGTMTFSKWKGRNYVRQTVTPSNPRSPAQVATRAMMKFLSQAWATIGATAQGTWEALASSKSITPFNAYTAANMLRWTQNQTPSEATPPAMIVGADANVAPTATGGVGQIELSCTTTGGPNDWGLIIYRSTTTGFTPTHNDVVAVIPITGNGPVTFVDSPLLPGTYYYVQNGFSEDGNIGTPSTQASATAT